LEISGAKVKYTEMTVYEDLKVRNSDTCTKSLGIRSNAKVYKKKPKKCTHCGSTSIVRIEVLGAYRGTLFWECDRCERLFCRLPVEETEKCLQKGKGMWTNRTDWIPPSKENLN
jgi:hypothetical protein